MYLSKSECFPSKFIGSKLEISSNKGTVIIHAPGEDAQVSSSGYTFTNAYWIESDGVLVVETESDVKLFFLGLQRSFASYKKGAKLPHDNNGYERAVAECKRYRDEEARKNILKQKNEKKSNSGDLFDSSTSSRGSSSSDDDGCCVKLMCTIIPILPIWWLIKLVIKSGASIFVLIWWFIKAFFYVITWPIRILLYCCLDKDSRRFLPKLEINVWPAYSFKKF